MSVTTSMLNFLIIIIFTLVITNQFTIIIGKPLKTIQAINGAIYDCVDFYKQPAFDHPLLNNHNFYPEMKPISRPKWVTSERSRMEKNDSAASYFKFFKDGGCPKNTVPIRRINEEDRARVNSMSKTLTSQLNPGTYRAVAQTDPNRNTAIYTGVGAELSIWNPQAGADQYSSSQILIQNGPDSIQVGVMVNPTLYGDNMTHAFIHTTTASGSHCFNNQCPGFVLVRSEYPPDVIINEVCTKGGKVYTIPYLIYRDTTSGNYWLEFDTPSIVIGFWPNKIFNGLAKAGSYLECGGETYSPPDKPEGPPPMGSGLRILGRGDFKYDAFCSNFVTVNEQNKIVDVDDTHEFCNSDKYDVKDIGHEIKELGHTIFFGGPGR